MDRAYSRLWILRRFKTLGTGVPELLDVYRHQIRSVLELAAPVWHSSLTLNDRAVQKSSLQIILGDRYLTYKNALQTANLKSLEQRRNQLCLKFTSKAVKTLSTETGLNSTKRFPKKFKVNLLSAQSSQEQ